MLESVVHDIPRCIGLSLGMTILAVLVTFRRRSSAVAVLAALAVGVAWVALGMVVAGVRIHFFNFIALPITFGIGVDYAVNVVQRYDAEGRRGILGRPAQHRGAGHPLQPDDDARLPRAPRGRSTRRSEASACSR